MRVTEGGFRELAGRWARARSPCRCRARGRLRARHAARPRPGRARRLRRQQKGPSRGPFAAASMFRHPSLAEGVCVRSKHRPAAAARDPRRGNGSPSVGETDRSLGRAQAARATASCSSASRREDTPSFRRRLLTCERTVCSEMKRRFAISSVPRCSSSSSRTSSSRAESVAAIESGTPRRGPCRGAPARAGDARSCRRELPRLRRRRRGTRRSAREARSSGGSRRRRARIAASRFSSVPEAVRTTTSASGAASRSARQRARPSRPGMDRSSSTRSGLEPRGLDDRLARRRMRSRRRRSRARRAARTVPRGSAGGRRRSGSWLPFIPLIGSDASADKREVRKAKRRTDYQNWLWGEILLAGLLGASLALFLNYPVLRTSYDLPELRLVLQTTMALAGLLVAVLAGARYSTEGPAGRPAARERLLRHLALVRGLRDRPALRRPGGQAGRELVGAHRRDPRDDAHRGGPVHARPQQVSRLVDRERRRRRGHHALRRVVASARTRPRAAGAEPGETSSSRST